MRMAKGRAGECWKHSPALAASEQFLDQGGSISMTALLDIIAPQELSVTPGGRL